jgi:peptide/nickel transport system permease protein
VSVNTASSGVPALRRLSVSRTWSARIGIGGLVVLGLLALIGPYVSPHAPEAIVGAPVAPPSGAYPFGTDLLGRDVLSRALWGGRALLAYALLATFLAYLIGAAIGMLAGFLRGVVGSTIMRIVDILLVFPPLLLLLLLISGLGTSMYVVVLGIVALHVPSIARIVNSATLETSVRGFVEAAVARGESIRYILGREIFPNIIGTIAADAGPRVTVSIFLIAGLNFLGLGIQPPAADWALMITENRQAISVQPWAVAVPVILIAAITLALNLTSDAIARSYGRMLDVGEMARR